MNDVVVRSEMVTAMHGDERRCTVMHGDEHHSSESYAHNCGHGINGTT